MTGTLDVVNEIVRNSNSTDLRYRFTMLRNYYYNEAQYYYGTSSAILIQLLEAQKIDPNSDDSRILHRRLYEHCTVQSNAMHLVHMMDILLSNEQDANYYQYAR
jgi:hypothetical protein